MENSYYKLEEVNRHDGTTGYQIFYKVVDFDGDEEKIIKMLEELNSKCMFFETFYDKQQNGDGSRIIELDVMHLD